MEREWKKYILLEDKKSLERTVHSPALLISLVPAEE